MAAGSITSDRHYSEVVAAADHYKAIGITEVYLLPRSRAVPWGIVNTCEVGSANGVELRTSVHFSGPHTCGLVFKWWQDFESPTERGTPDIDECRAILEKLRGPAYRGFAEVVRINARVAQKMAKDFQKSADAKAALASALQALAP